MYHSNLSLLLLIDYSFKKECVSNFERWIYVLKNMGKLERMPFKAKDAVFKRLEEIGSLLMLDSDQRRRYDNSLDNYRDNAATMAYAESVAREEGMEKGIQQGIQKGIEKGIEQGIEKGKKEGIMEGIKAGVEKGKLATTREIARSLKAVNTNIEIIASVTGLSLEEINTL